MALYTKDKKMRLTFRMSRETFDFLRFVAHTMYSDSPALACRGLMDSCKNTLLNDPQLRSQYEDYVAKHPSNDTSADDTEEE